ELLCRSECAREAGAPAARKAKGSQNCLEHALVAQHRVERLARMHPRQQRMRVGDRACVRRRDVRFAKILDAGLEELRRAVALLAEDFAKVSIAARRSCLAGDVIEADRDREFRTQAQRLAGLTFGQEYAATKVF